MKTKSRGIGRRPVLTLAIAIAIALISPALASAHAGGWFKPDALVVVEEAADAGFQAPAGFTELERRQYDDTEFTFLRAS